MDMVFGPGQSGLMSVTGEGGGRPPVKVGSPCTDIMCGTLGALGIAGALRQRELTGVGLALDIKVILTPPCIFH